MLDAFQSRHCVGRYFDLENISKVIKVNWRVSDMQHQTPITNVEWMFDKRFEKTRCQPESCIASSSRPSLPQSQLARALKIKIILRHAEHLSCRRQRSLPLSQRPSPCAKAGRKDLPWTQTFPPTWSTWRKKGQSQWAANMGWYW